MKKELIKSKVEFRVVEHEYWLYDQQLKGITGFLSKYLFQSKYDSVPEKVMKRACERGSLIHAQISDFFNGFRHENELQETKNFHILAKELGLTFIASEYLVSDEINFASPIDLVGSNFDLYDIKTTAVLDVDYISWQLSIYAYLFELQNGFHCGDLYAIWLKGDKKKLVPIAKIDNEILDAFLCHCIIGEGEYENPLSVLPERTEMLLEQLADAYKEIELHKEEMAMIEAEVLDKKEALVKIIVDGKKKKLETDTIRVSYTAPTSRISIDGKKLKEENKEVFDKYSKVIEVKGSVRIKLLE